MSRAAPLLATTPAKGELRSRILAALMCEWPGYLSVLTLRERLGAAPSSMRRVLGELVAEGRAERGAAGGWRSARPSAPTNTTRLGRPLHRCGLREEWLRRRALAAVQGESHA